MLHVDPEDPHSSLAQALLAQLTRELADRYPEDGGEGRGRCAPPDVVGPRSIFLVAWFGSEAVGCGALRPFEASADTAEITRMFVEPAQRGKGIGREILHELEQHAHGFGYTRLYLDVGVRQPEAVALYEKAGFIAMPDRSSDKTNSRSLCFAKTISRS